MVSFYVKLAESVFFPSPITVCPMKTISCIIVFDRDGNFLYKFGKQGKGKGEFNEPRCLSVNKAGHLMVCDTLNHRVQVFELSAGKFVAKFGALGRGIGEFDGPFSLAVLSDGRVLVTEWGNDRIQLFK